jgi:hypothetical protein
MSLMLSVTVALFKSSIVIDSLSFEKVSCDMTVTVLWMQVRTVASRAGRFNEKTMRCEFLITSILRISQGTVALVAGGDQRDANGLLSLANTQRQTIPKTVATTIMSCERTNTSSAS